MLTELSGASSCLCQYEALHKDDTPFWKQWIHGVNLQYCSTFLQKSHKSNYSLVLSRKVVNTRDLQSIPTSSTSRDFTLNFSFVHYRNPFKILEISRGTWPTTVDSRCTLTACLSCALPLSMQTISRSPIVGCHTDLYTWWPRTTLLKSTVGISECS